MKPISLLLSLAALILLTSACGTYHGDVQMICEAPLKVPNMDNLPTPEKQKKLAHYISDNLKTSEGKALFEALAPAPPQTRKEALYREANKAGLTECAMADQYTATSTEDK